jgi:3',5'-cyclic AMP phosphodiesterase CpdA
MPTLAHISDLHFGREIPRVIEGLLASLDEACPDLVIISGDLTQRARAGQFRNAKRFLDRLSCPHLIVPGNHDLPLYNLFKRFSCPWGNWTHFVSQNLEPVVRGDDFIIAGVNTARRWATLFDQTRGRISAGQTASAITHLKTAPDTHLRILVAHHPFWLPAELARRHRVGGRDRALAALREAGVDMILSGHVHVAFSQRVEGIIVAHSGTSTSNRTSGQANSFNIIRGDRRRISIDVRLWNGRIFEPFANRIFVRNADQWMIDPPSVSAPA